MSRFERPVFFVCGHSNHLRCFLPVVRALDDDGVRLLILGEAVRKGRLARRQLASLDPSRWTILEKSMAERVAARLAPERYSRGRRWSRRVGRWAASIGGPPPLAVVPLLPTDFATLRREMPRGARVLCLQHDPYLWADRRDVLTRFEVDRYLVWGGQMSRYLRDRGVRAPIVVTGAPHLSRIAPRTEPLPGGRPATILYATQPAAERSSESRIPERVKGRVLTDLLAALARLPSVGMTVKLHPADDGRVERETLAAHPDLARRVGLLEHEPGQSIYDLIDAADVVVTIYSTVGLEALVRGCPVLLLNHDGVRSRAAEMFGGGYLDEGALEATDAASVEAGLRALLFDPVRRRELLERTETALTDLLEVSGDESVARIRTEIASCRPAAAGPA